MENENITTNELPIEEIKKETTEKTCGHKHCRCYLNLILNIIAIVGVIILFVIHFTGKSGNVISMKKSGNASLTIGFVNSDSVMENYDLVKTVKSALEKKQKEAEASFTAQQSAFETAVTEYQTKLKANTLSIEQAQNTEKLLAKKQENLYSLKEDLAQTLSDEELKMNVMLQDSIVNFLKRYNRKHNYDYVLGFAKGSGILFANDSLDLTKEVLEELNKEYKSGKSDK